MSLLDEACVSFQQLLLCCVILTPAIEEATKMEAWP